MINGEKGGHIGDVNFMKQSDGDLETVDSVRWFNWKPLAMFWGGFWLAVVLVIAKGFSLGVPESWHWGLRLVQSSFRDVLFAVAFGLCGQGVLWAVARHRRWSKTICLTFATIGGLFAIYAVVAYGVFKALDRPLSFDLIRLMRGAAVQSSIMGYLTWPIALALILAPAMFIFLVWLGAKRPTFPRLLLGGMGLWIMVGLFCPSEASAGLRGERLSLSPHLELLRSALMNVTGNRKGAIPGDFSGEDQEEFQVFWKRGKAPRSGFKPMEGIARPKNVIVLVLESVGTKYLNLYGSPYETMPNLRKEAEHAMVFEQIYAHAPYTFSTFMAVNFSIYPALPWIYAPSGWAAEGKEVACLPPTLARVLQSRGHRTAYFHNGDMDWGGQNFMLQKVGYDIVEDHRDLGAPMLTSWGVEDRFLFDRLIRWIGEKPGQPFLAYCWTDQTHNPYARRPNLASEDFFMGRPKPAHSEALGKYLNVIRDVDAQIARLLATLRELGLADDTLVVVTGDHGEAFGDPHDQQGHGFTVFEEEVHVPLVLWNPRLFPEGRRSGAVGGHVDLNATIADVLGVPVPDEWQGHSLFVEGRPNRTFFVSSVDGYSLGMREDQWKYFFDAKSGKGSLFDLEADPLEKRDLFALEADRVKRMRQRLSAWIAFEEAFLQAPLTRSPED